MKIVKQQNLFASTQCIIYNPILEESIGMRTQYFVYLKNLIRRVGGDEGKYTKEYMEFYKQTLGVAQDAPKSERKFFLNSRFCYLIPFDISILLGLNSRVKKKRKGKSNVSKIISNEIIKDFSLSKTEKSYLRKNLMLH